MYKNMINQLIQKLQSNFEFYTLNAILVSLVFYQNITTLLLILFFLHWVYKRKWRNIPFVFKKHPGLFILPILYLLYLLGLLYSENIHYALNKLETKLGLLIFPFLFSTSDELNNSKLFQLIKKNYLIASLAGASICYIIATYHFLFELYCRKKNIILSEYPYTNYFFTSYLSYFFHYGYYAMYINIGLMFAYSLFYEKILKFNWFIITTMFLSVFIMMLGSKAGIISMFIIHLLFIIRYFLHQRYINIRSLYLILNLIILSLILFMWIPHTKSRVKIISDVFMKKKVDSSSTESTQLRYFAWRTSINLIKKRPILGYGTGDANDVILQEYKIKNYYGPLKKEINAHNQFMQTAISIGLGGTALLLLFFLWLIYIGFKYKNFYIQVFSIITFIAYLFESYLETQAGVFYTIIFSMIFFKNATSKYSLLRP